MCPQPTFSSSFEFHPFQQSILIASLFATFLQVIVSVQASLFGSSSFLQHTPLKIHCCCSIDVDLMIADFHTSQKILLKCHIFSH